MVGSQAHRVLAFARSLKGKTRHCYRDDERCADLQKNSAEPRIDALQWGDTRVKLPFAASDEHLKGLFSSVAVTKHRELNISAALGIVPVNLFIQHFTQA